MSFPLRAVYDNAADRSTLSVTGAPTLPVQNLLTNNKNETYRSAAGVTSVTFTATYFTAETISCAAFYPCNFSPTATMRVRLYSDAACTSLLRDSGVLLCSEGGGSSVAGLTAAQSASAYSYGGGSSATVWLTRTTGVLGVKLDVVDTANLQGYLDAARLVLGDYMSPQYNAEYGANVTLDDSTENYRTDAGNLISDVGTRHKKLSINLTFLMPADRGAVWKLVKKCGRSGIIFMSLFPENPDKELEHTHTILGKFTSMSAVTATNYMIYSFPMEIESL